MAHLMLKDDSEQIIFHIWNLTALLSITHMAVGQYYKTTIQIRYNDTNTNHYLMRGAQGTAHVVHGKYEKERLDIDTLCVPINYETEMSTSSSLSTDSTLRLPWGR